VHGEPAMGEAWGSQGKRRTWCGLIDLDAHCFLAHDLPYFRRRGGAVIALALYLPVHVLIDSIALGQHCWALDQVF
jgi:hypothetical protein